jgi:soluble cytochrome b562
MKALKVAISIGLIVSAFLVVFFWTPPIVLLPIGAFFVIIILGSWLMVSSFGKGEEGDSRKYAEVQKPLQSPQVVRAAAAPTPSPSITTPKAVPELVVDRPTGQSSVAEATLTELQQELEARKREATDFKKAIETKNREIETLRASLNRADLKEYHEGIANLLQSVEFFKQRLALGKEAPEAFLPQVEEGILEVLDRTKLIKGIPEVGQRLADQPTNSCTIFNRIPAPTPEQKGIIAEVRNSWVGFQVESRLEVVNPSRVAVYV